MNQVFVIDQNSDLEFVGEYWVEIVSFIDVPKDEAETDFKRLDDNI